jgi:molecular chaperone GrpE (heat shock protein)
MANYSASQSAISRGQDNAALNHGFAGQAILNLLHKAADTAEANSRQALETAQKLSSQLEAAKDRIARLESEVGHYQKKAERAEEWLHKISAEIENRLITAPQKRRQQMFRRS